MIGYAARVRLVRRLLREGHGPARVGAAGRGTVAAVFDTGTGVVIGAEAVEVLPPATGPAQDAAVTLATRLAALTGLPLLGADPDASPGPSPF